jgi:prephenate dehydrogenase
MSLAAGGFESTVRLSKSNGDTWAPIFIGNSGPILEVIDTYIDKMQLFKTHIKNGDGAALRNVMKSANEIGQILK